MGDIIFSDNEEASISSFQGTTSDANLEDEYITSTLVPSILEDITGSNQNPVVEDKTVGSFQSLIQKRNVAVTSSNNIFIYFNGTDCP